MALQHIIISSDTMIRQLISGILRKNSIEFTDLLTIDETVEKISNSIFLVDLVEDLYEAEILWENSNIYNIRKKCLFFISSEHPLRKTILQHCSAEQVILKPINPDKLYLAIEKLNIESTETTVNNDVQDNNRESFMKRALDISFTKMKEEHCAPFGAVIVKNNKIIAEGWSQVIQENDPTAHAEIVALRKAGKISEYYKLQDCEIYTSTEPCPMCLAALYLAGIQKIYYANSQDDAEGFGFGRQTLYDEIAMPRDKRIMPYIRMMEDEAIYALEDWNNNFTTDGYNITKE